MSKIFNKDTVIAGNEDNMAVVLYEDGDVLYVCKAPTGTLLASALWQIKKVDTSSGVVITWCDGDSKYDQAATDLATVSGYLFS